MSGSELLSVLVVHWLTRAGGWRRISSRYRDTEAGEWEQVNNHEDSVGDVINWSVSPAPPRPGPGLRHNSGLWKNVRSKSEHAPRLGPGVLHTYSRVTAAWCMQLRASNKHFSCPQLWCCEGRPDSWSANWPRDLAILGSFIIITRAKTTLYFFQAAIYLLVSLFGFQ